MINAGIMLINTQMEPLVILQMNLEKLRFDGLQLFHSYLIYIYHLILDFFLLM